MKTIILDTETTGLANKDQVIELGIIDADTTETLFHSYFCPTVDIHPDAQETNGLSLEDLADAPPWPDYHEEILKILLGADLILAYNSPFDFRLIRQTVTAFSLPWPYTGPTVRDLMVPYANIAQISWNKSYQSWKWQSLAAACTQQEIDLSDLKMHTALDDCIATQRLYQKLKPQFEEIFNKGGY